MVKTQYIQVVEQYTDIKTLLLVTLNSNARDKSMNPNFVINIIWCLYVNANYPYTNLEEQERTMTKGEENKSICIYHVEFTADFYFLNIPILPEFSTMTE